MDETPQVEDKTTPVPTTPEVTEPTEYEKRRDAAQIVATLIAGSVMPKVNPMGMISDLTDKMVKVLDGTFEYEDPNVNIK